MVWTLVLKKVLKLLLLFCVFVHSKPCGLETHTFIMHSSGVNQGAVRVKVTDLVLKRVMEIQEAGSVICCGSPLLMRGTPRAVKAVGAESRWDGIEGTVTA